jgi:hypothetical protein
MARLVSRLPRVQSRRDGVLCSAEDARCYFSGLLC